MRLELIVLAATVLVMLIVWWAYRRWRGRGYMTVLVSILTIALGAVMLYFSMSDAFRGWIDCYGSRCVNTIKVENNPAHFLLSVVLYAAVAAFLIGRGAYHLHAILRAMTRGAQHRIMHSRYGDRAGLLWAAAAICVVGLSATLLAAKHAADFAESARYPREPLQLRLDPATKSMP